MTTQTVQRSKPSSNLARYMPILSWLPNYNRAWLVADILAGLTLWGLVVPEGMAYAGIAGLPAHAGRLAIGVCPVRYLPPPLGWSDFCHGCPDRLHGRRRGRHDR